MTDPIVEIIPCTQEDQERGNRIMRGILILSSVWVFAFGVFLYSSILSKDTVSIVLFSSVVACFSYKIMSICFKFSSIEKHVITGNIEYCRHFIGGYARIKLSGMPKSFLCSLNVFKDGQDSYQYMRKDERITIERIPNGSVFHVYRNDAAASYPEKALISEIIPCSHDDIIKANTVLKSLVVLYVRRSILIVGIIAIVLYLFFNNINVSLQDDPIAFFYMVGMPTLILCGYLMVIFLAYNIHSDPTKKQMVTASLLQDAKSSFGFVKLHLNNGQGQLNKIVSVHISALDDNLSMRDLRYNDRIIIEQSIEPPHYVFHVRRAR